MGEVVNLKEIKEEKIPKGRYCDNCPYYETIGINYLIRDLSIVTEELKSILSSKDQWKECPHSGNCTANCIRSGQPVCYEKRVRCDYLNYTDNNEDTLLHDGVKQCAINF